MLNPNRALCLFVNHQSGCLRLLAVVVFVTFSNILTVNSTASSMFYFKSHSFSKQIQNLFEKIDF
jgi:ACT domain-containing protein